MKIDFTIAKACLALCLSLAAFGVNADESVEDSVTAMNHLSNEDIRKYGETLSELKKTEIILKQQVAIRELENELQRLQLESGGNTVERQVEEAIKDEREQMQKRMDAMKSAYEDRIKALQDRLTGAADGQEITGNIYVTRIAGAGDNIKARIFFENNIRDRVVGEQIAPGVVIKKIHPNGIVVNDNGSERFIDLTTDGLAYLKTFEPLVKEPVDPMSGMLNAVPIMPSPAMGAQSFGVGP